MPVLLAIFNKSLTNFLGVFSSFLLSFLFKKNFKANEILLFWFTIKGNSFNCERFLFCFNCFTFNKGVMFISALFIVFLWFLVDDL